MGHKKTSCLTRLVRVVSGLIFLSAIVYFIADTFIYLPGQKFSHPQTSDVRGIDVSVHQGRINWNKVKSATIDDDKISFVLIKATEGASLKDKYFRRNFRNARDKGIIRGAYHFWSYKKSPESQAKNFISSVKLRKGDLPPVLDTEEFPKNYDKDKFRKDALRWLEIIEEHYGVTPIIYACRDFKWKYLSTDEFDRFPLWIAHYNVKKPVYTGSWKFWQYSTKGRLPGIGNDVDLNVFDGTYGELLNLTIR